MSKPIILDPKLDLSAASALRATLLAHEQANITLDFSKVTHLGALCLQVLLSASKTAQAQGTTMTLINLSDRVVEQLRLMGLSADQIVEGAE